MRIKATRCHKPLKKLQFSHNKFVLLEEGKNPRMGIFEGKTPVNKLWLSFEKRADLDLRLTKNYLMSTASSRLFKLIKGIKMSQSLIR